MPPAYTPEKTYVVRNAFLSCRCQWNVDRMSTRARSCHSPILGSDSLPTNQIKRRMTPSAYAPCEADVVRNVLLSCRCQWNVGRVNARTHSRHPRWHHPLPTPIPDRFSHMRPKNIRTTSKISNRPRHPQDAMHRSRRQLQQVDGVFQHRLILGG